MALAQAKTALMDTPKKDLAQQIGDIERAYGGIRSWKRAVETENTKLSYEHWLVARTQDFKAQFGDWEAKLGVARLETMPPLDLNGVARSKGKEDIKKAFSNFGVVKNHYDKSEILFPNSIAGKIEEHKGFEMVRIVNAFNSLFERSHPMRSELEEIRENHKIHTGNVNGYRHYVSKFKQDGKEYYIRFSVQDLKSKNRGEDKNQIHSAFVSSVSIYGYSADTPSSAWGQVNLVITESSANITRYDRKLAEWLAAGKSELAPNGKILPAREPLEPEILSFLENQNFRIPKGHVTLPLSSKSEKMIRLANEVRRSERKPDASPERLRAAESFEAALNAIEGPGLTAIPLKRLAIAFSLGKCSEKKLREAALENDQANSRRRSLQRGKETALGNSHSIDL